MGKRNVNGHQSSPHDEYPPPPRYSLGLLLLRQVWHLHRRIKYYMGLTLIAIIVDLGVGMGGIMFVLTEEPLYMVVTWAARCAVFGGNRGLVSGWQARLSPLFCVCATRSSRTASS